MAVGIGDMYTTASDAIRCVAKDLSSKSVALLLSYMLMGAVKLAKVYSCQ